MMARTTSGSSSALGNPYTEVIMLYLEATVLYQDPETLRLMYVWAYARTTSRIRTWEQQMVHPCIYVH